MKLDLTIGDYNNLQKIRALAMDAAKEANGCGYCLFGLIAELAKAGDYCSERYILEKLNLTFREYDWKVGR